MLHVQAGVNGWLESVQRLPDKSLIVAIDQVSMLREAKNANHKVKTALRHWYDPGQVFGGNLEANKVKARTFFNTFIDGTFMQFASSVDFVEEWNEYLATGMPQWELDSRITWATAAAQVWKEEYRTKPGLGHIKLVLANTAVGNDIPWQWAKIAHDYDAVIGYHPYSNWVNGHRWATEEHPNADWLFLSGRWATMDADYRARGFNVTWVFTEAGPYSGAMDGWKSEDCLNGNRALYVEAMRQWINDCSNTPAYQEGRLEGFALFTVGNVEPWHHFWHDKEMLNMLADMVAVEWKPGTEPLPPPPPPPDDDDRAIGTDVSYWQGEIDFEMMEAKGAAYCFIRGTMGLTSHDSNIEANLAGVRDTEMLWSIYHVFLPGTDPVGQAEQLAEWYPDDALLPPVVDIEIAPSTADSESIEDVDTRQRLFYGWEGNDFAFDSMAISPDAFAADIKVFLDKVEELTGKTPIIYTGAWFWNPNVGYQAWAKDYPLWVANYTTAENPVMPVGWDAWEFWQYSSTDPGWYWGASSTYIDINRFYGDEVTLWIKYGNWTPPPPPDTENVLKNGSFEDGWYHPEGIPELQIPEDWGFWYATDSTANPYDPSPGAVFVRPEVRVLPKEQLPPSEQGFVLDGNYTLKPFKGDGSLYFKFSQEMVLEAGQYEITLPIFADLVKGYNPDGSKIWADDPNGHDGLVWILLDNDIVIDALSLIPGEWNIITWDFEVEEGGDDVTLTVQFMMPFPLANNGLFLDDWRLERVGGPFPPPEVDYVVVANLLPQDATRAEAAFVLENVYDLKQTVLFSADDAARLVAPGKVGSKVKVWSADRWDGDIVDWLHDRGVLIVELHDLPE